MKKKYEPLYVGYVYLRPGKFFRNQILLDCLGRWRNQSCQIFFQSVHSDVFGKGSNFAIFSVNHGWPLQLLYYINAGLGYNCDYVFPPNNKIRVLIRYYNFNIRCAQTD